MNHELEPSSHVGLAAPHKVTSCSQIRYNSLEDLSEGFNSLNYYIPVRTLFKQCSPLHLVALSELLKGAAASTKQSHSTQNLDSKIFQALQSV